MKDGDEFSEVNNVDLIILFDEAKFKGLKEQLHSHGKA